MAKQINDFQEGDHLTLFALVKDAQVRLTKKGANYLALTFGDQSGELTGNLWDVTDQQIQEFQPGVVVYLNGQRTSYQGQPQIQIESVRLARDNEPNQPELYVERAPEAEEQIKADLRPFVKAIQEPTWRKIVNQLMVKHGEAFFQSPAAKTNHHAYVGGLSYHTLSILRLAQSVTNLYSGINKSLLYAGALLHDLGKTVELSGAVGTQYTTTGKLLGHISLIDGEICATCQDLGIDYESETVVLLRHMVLSHHGLLEYGSPVRPELLEAEILHHLDELDASIMMMGAALGKVQPGEFTGRLFALDNRAFYEPTENTKK
ncbi:3'-5' exoribonuclease YhaM family protein [uncultured Limosilactobacillus sp.]|uniref:3'-5' exoribonuclease YhaM family protein n=1 Tax=uncultured Limosilactobacillus sp. TaxID=2837629 RepID=UPI0025E2A57B|nr:HD domain-containing protein [uncultured Limosilactobacillus sp.]